MVYETCHRHQCPFGPTLATVIVTAFALLPTVAGCAGARKSQPEATSPAQRVSAPTGGEESARPCETTTAIYVTDVQRYQILRMAPDGSNVHVLISGVNASDIDIDVTHRKMYWPHHDRDIMRANLDGSSVEVLRERMPSPYGLALDVAGQRVFWTNQLGDPKVQSSTLSGADVRDLVPGKAQFMIGIAVDAVNQALYWMEGYYGGRVVRASIDGGNPKPIATTVGIATGIAVDPVGGKIYWTEYGNGPHDDAVRRANLDGSNVETLFDATHGLQTPDRIAVDSWAGKIYWVDLHGGRVQRSNLDGTGLETLLSGLGYPRGIALLQYASCEEARAHREADNAPVPSPSVVSPELREAVREKDPRPRLDTTGPLWSRNLPRATVTLGKPRLRSADQAAAAASPLKPEQVEAVVKRHIGMLRACYEREFLRSPSLAGKVVVNVMIDERGGVTTARIHQSSLGHVMVEGCILERFRRMKFPSVAHPGGRTVVQYPLVLEVIH